MGDYFMETKEQDGLWIVFENCESICVPEGCVQNLQLSGIKKIKNWYKDTCWSEFTLVEDISLSLYVPDMNPEYISRLKRHQDITSIHFQGEEYIIEFKGEMDNAKQETRQYHDVLVVSICDDNLE